MAETISQAGARPLQPPQPTFTSLRNRNRCRRRYPIPPRSPFSGRNPNERIPSPVPTQERTDKSKPRFDRPPGHLSIGGSEEDAVASSPESKKGWATDPYFSAVQG
jgi:hypothetical protein